jgi:hypothetical protein
MTYGEAHYKLNKQFALTNTTRDPIRAFIAEVEADWPQADKGTGTAYYVDSGVTSAGAGTSWTTAVQTLQEGIDLCSANAGDRVYVAQGHAEDITNASALDADCAGITIIGLGKGEDQPEISFITDATAELTISAADVTIYNMRFLSNYAGGITAAIQVTADGDGARIIGCDFRETANTSEMLIAINAASDADELVIAENRFISIAGGSDTQSINLSNSDYTEIVGNVFYGDWSDYVIAQSTASTGMLIAQNTIHNLDTGAGQLIKVNSSTTGSIVGNSCYGNGATFVIISAAMYISPDNVVMQTENVAARNYETMFGEFTGATGGAQGTSVYADMVLAQTDLDAIIADFTDYALDELASSDDSAGATAYPDSVVTDSILAYIMSSDRDPTGYDNTTDSLEAIGTDTDALIVSNASIAASIAALSDTGYVGTNSATSQTAPVVALLAGFGDDYFNTDWSMIITHNIDSDGSAPEGEIRDITDYSSATGTFTIETLTANLGNGDGVMVRRTEDLELDIPTVLGSAQTIRYVDSGTSGDGSGLTWENAYATVALAEAACAAGDVVYIADGHDEEVTTGTLVLNIANTSFIGLGEGNARPLITCTDDGLLMTIDNAGITVKNLRLQAGVTACDAGIRVEDAGIGVTIENLSFIDGEASGTDEFVDGISVDALASNLTVKNCTWYSLDATGHTDTFVNLDEVTIDSPTITGCTVFGMFTEAPIWASTAVPVNVTITDNILSNTTTGQLCIEFQGAATGVCARNMLYSDTMGANAITIIDPGSLKCIDNWATDAINETAIRVPISQETSDVTGVADGSDLERLEYLQAQTEDIMARIGIDSTTAEVWYVDSVSASGGDGTSWAQSEDTLKAAVDDATDNVGAYIFVAPGHAENVGGDTAMNCPGITIIGMGTGDGRPKLTFDTAGDVLTHTVASITYKNIIFICSTQDTTVGMTLDASSDGTILEDCEFRNTTTNEFVDTITLAAGTDFCRFTRCVFLNNTAAGGNISCINSTAGVTNNTVVEDCTFYGAFTTAAIESDQIEVNWTLRNCHINNTSTGDYAVRFSAAALGQAYNNKMYADTYGTVFDPGSLACFENRCSSAIDQSGVVTPGIPQYEDKVHGTGQIFFVDASGSNGDGRTPATAVTTLDAGINLTTANRGDFVYVMQGHTETFTAADGFDADVAGISIIGLGNGLNAPIFLFNHTDAEVAVSGTGDNVLIENLRFHTTIDSVKIGLDIEAGADHVTIRNCTWDEQGDATGTDEFDEALQVNACDNVTVEGCTFKAEAAEAVSAISGSGISTYLTIKDCIIMGDYSGACINFDTASSTDAHVIDNILINGDLVADNGLNAVAAIKFTDGSGGFIKGNHIACDVATALLMRVCDDMVFMDNRVTDSDGDDNTDGDESIGAGVAIFADG